MAPSGLAGAGGSFVDAGPTGVSSFEQAPAKTASAKPTVVMNRGMGLIGMVQYRCLASFASQISPFAAAASSSASLASLNSPSHLAMTTVARQLPTTLVIVRAMSMSSSTPRISVMPTSGRL